MMRLMMIDQASYGFLSLRTVLLCHQEGPSVQNSIADVLYCPSSLRSLSIVPMRRNLCLAAGHIPVVPLASQDHPSIVVLYSLQKMIGTLNCQQNCPKT